MEIPLTLHGFQKMLSYVLVFHSFNVRLLVVSYFWALDMIFREQQILIPETVMILKFMNYKKRFTEVNRRD